MDEPAWAGLPDRRRLLIGAAGVGVGVPLMLSVLLPAMVAAASGSEAGQLTAVTQGATPSTGGQPVSVAFSPDGTLLATANYDPSDVPVFTSADTV